MRCKYTYAKIPIDAVCLLVLLSRQMSTPIPAPIPFHEAIPRYHQIAQLLRQRAATGELGAKDGKKKGFTEQALCDEFGVSRTTIRQALGMLKRDGVLASRRGVGT